MAEPAERGPATADLGRPPTRRERVLYWFVRGLVAVIARLWFRLEVHGREHLPDGPFVLAPVHRSNIDFLLAACVTPRRMRYMGKHTIWKYEGLGRFFTALGAFPVHRGSADREALRRCEASLSGGEPLVMFPEGTRQSGPVVEELFDGPAFVAARAGVPIVPVGIGGSEAAMPRGAKGIHRVKVAVVVGEPMPAPVGEDGKRPSRKQVRATTEELRSRVQLLFDDAQRRAGRLDDL
jgi:1-acyl-sn-glycerol-3-phosphate acyltransferase